MGTRKVKWVNIVLVIGMVLFLFTPVGRYVSVFSSRLLASCNVVEKSESQTNIDDYNWQLVNTEGEDFNLEEARNKIVIVNFWATWCPPCIAEMPSLQKLYGDYRDKIVFVLVANDKADKVSAFIGRKGYDLPVYFSKTEAPTLLTAEVLPTTYVIDRQGKIIVAHTGAADWNSEEVRNVLDGLLRE
ncbi:MAG: thiol-disulfide oxidoreductase [Maribacter sp.]|nr:MAG: thiol-disulfide oxidoreductase [Maribacter sp.]